VQQPDCMQAITIRGGKGGADALEITTVPRPIPGPGQILIRVIAAGVNRPDIAQREGLYPPPEGASEILGLEIAGNVAAVGPGTVRWTEGDSVVALLPGGGYAQYAVVDERHALPMPTGLSPIESAALPETVFTVWTNMFERGRLSVGEQLLVHGANSGIGVMAIQMAIAAGASVLATVRGKDKADKVRALGVRLAIDAAGADWAVAVRDAGGADVILDMVGSEYFARNVEVLKTEGRLIVIATLSGNRVEVDLRQMMTKRLTLSASTLRSRLADEKARLARSVEAAVWPWIAAGKVRPIVEKTFPLAEASAAHAWLESGSHFGKVVLTV
jgi:NADPH:quinone reductase